VHGLGALGYGLAVVAANSSNGNKATREAALALVLGLLVAAYCLLAAGCWLLAAGCLLAARSREEEHTRAALAGREQQPRGRRAFDCRPGGQPGGARPAERRTWRLAWSVTRGRRGGASRPSEGGRSGRSAVDGPVTLGCWQFGRAEVGRAELGQPRQKGESERGEFFALWEQSRAAREVGGERALESAAKA